MGQVTANGNIVLTGRITIPRIGAWHCDLEVDAEENLTGEIVITDGTATFNGTVVRSDALGSRIVVRAVGGKGGLRAELGAKHYVDCPLRIPVRDIIGDAGETLSNESAGDLLETRLGHWSRGAMPAGSALSSILEPYGAAWRVLADGTIWVGVETWPDVGVEGFLELDPEPELGTFTIASDSLDLKPGVTFLGRRISRVEHIIEENRSRTCYWAEDAGTAPALDRIKEPLARFVRWVMRSTLYLGAYPSTVQRQDPSTGLLDLLPDDERLRGKGTSGVQIRHGLPGVAVEVPTGARALLQFDNGDPRKPFAALWETGSITSITLDGGTQKLARQGDLCQSGGPGTQCVLTGIAAPPNGAVIVGAPYLISFSMTPQPQSPLFGAIVTGAPRIKA